MARNGESKQEHGPGIAELIQLCDRREKKSGQFKSNKDIIQHTEEGKIR